MTLERDQDLVFDAEGWEAERFIAEVIRAERGLFPMRKRDPMRWSEDGKTSEKLQTGEISS